MKPIFSAILVATLLASCGGNPFVDDTTTDVPAGTTGSGNSAGKSMTRSEAEVKSGANKGDGYAKNISIEDPTLDPQTGVDLVEGDEVFLVDNLAFDGTNRYARSQTAPALGNADNPFFAYEANEVEVDGQGTVIDQFSYRAVYGKSASGKTNFAIVRTGSYSSYGFGGFVFERNGKFTFPTTPNGQAGYSGDYAGIRDFANGGNLEYVNGKMTIDIDFDDFNDGAGLKAVVYDRQIFDINGNEITDDVIAALNNKLDLEPVLDADGNVVTEAPNVALEALPVITFAVGPGVLKASGEINGGAGEDMISTNLSDLTTYLGSGKYFAIIADSPGLKANEIVGIVKLEAKDPRNDAVTVRETGGFILYHVQP